MLNERKLKKEIENIYRSEKNKKEYESRYEERCVHGINKTKSKSKSRENDNEIDVKQYENKIKTHYPNHMMNSKLNTRLLNSYFNNYNISNISGISTTSNNSKINQYNTNIKSKYPVPKNQLLQSNIQIINLPKNSCNTNVIKTNNKDNNNINVNLNRNHNTNLQTTPYDIKRRRPISDSPNKYNSRQEKYNIFFPNKKEIECINLSNSTSIKNKDLSKLYSRPFPYHTKKHFTSCNSPKKSPNTLLQSFEYKKPLPQISNDIYTHPVLKKSNSYILLKQNESHDSKVIKNDKCQNQLKVTTSEVDEDLDKNKNNLIFQLLYTKLKEIKISKNLNSSHLIETLIDVFDYLSHNVDNKYTKIGEILKYLLERINHATILNSHSSTTGSSIPTHHENKSEHLIDQLKKELKLKDLQIQSYLQKINEFERATREKEILTNTLNKKYHSMKAKFTAIKDEAKNLKTVNKDLKCEMEFLREKELKMMEVMFLLQRRGISIDEVMKDKSEKTEKSVKTDKSISLEKDSYFETHHNYNTDENYYMNAKNENDISITTVYFPDKVHPPSHIFDNYNVQIPKLDFTNLPGYESHSDNNSDIIKININTGGVNSNNNKNNYNNNSNYITDYNQSQNNPEKKKRDYSYVKHERIMQKEKSNNIPPKYDKNNIKENNMHKTKLSSFPVSNSVSLTNLHSVNYDNNSSLNSSNNCNNYNNKTIQNKDSSAIAESFDEYNDSNAKGIIINNITQTTNLNNSINNSNMNISKLKDSLKNFSLSNASLNNKIKMKQLNVKR